jgi:AraC-type DNA-binding domain-containing proteins
MEKSYELQVNKLLTKFNEFHLCFCGHSECEPSHSFGPAVRSTYIIHLVLSGKGSFSSNGNVYQLKQGQGFLITPNDLTLYEADKKDAWSYVWIGFDGANCKEYLNELGLSKNSPIFTTPHTTELQNLVLQMLHHNKIGTHHEFFHQGLLCQFFAWLAKNPQMNTPTSTNEQRSYYVQNAIKYIHNHYADEISIEHIADYTCINRSYLSTLFKNELGTSPSAYLANFRLSLSVNLLTVTDLPINSVAASCGYKDPLVFSKAFKRQYGISPRTYRKK